MVFPLFLPFILSDNTRSDEEKKKTEEPKANENGEKEDAKDLPTAPTVTTPLEPPPPPPPTAPVEPPTTVFTPVEFFYSDPYKEFITATARQVAIGVLKQYEEDRSEAGKQTDKPAAEPSGDGVACRKTYLPPPPPPPGPETAVFETEL